jgi:outer membrane lipoprotein-sorting protein
MKKLVLFLWVFILAFTSRAEAELTAKQAQQILQMDHAELQTRTGTFEQKKYFKVLKKPFVSSGNFDIKAGYLNWQTLVPIQSGIIFDDGALYLINSKGEQKVAPKAEHFAHLLVALLQGDIDTLSRTFMFKQQSEKCISLSPKEQKIAQAISLINICSQGIQQQISLFDVQENRTDITLNYAP